MQPGEFQFTINIMNPVTDAPKAIDFGRFRVLLHRRELLVDNQPVEFGARAFDVLLALIEAPGTVGGLSVNPVS